MSNTPNIAKLSATIDTGNGIESVSVAIAVNQAASATLNLGHKGDQIVVEPLPADVLKKIKELQTTRLAGVTKPDVMLNIDDAIYGTFDMKGFLSAPMLEISEAHIGYQMSVLDQVAILDALDLSIYQHVIGMMRQAEIPDEIPRPTGNVTKLLLELTDMLVSNFNNALTKETDPVKKKIIQMRHDLNQSGPLEIWRSILRKSRVVHKTWEAVIDLHENAGKTISEKTLLMLCTKSSGFWNVMNMLMSSFQMFYRPEPGPVGSYGRFVNNKEKMDTVDGEFELDITNLNVRDGSTRILQVGAVIMEAGGAPGMRTNEIQGATTPATAGLYPDPILKGYIHTEIPPIWLVDASGVPVLGSAADKSKDSQPSADVLNLSLAEYPARREGGVKHLTDVEARRSAVMSEMCEYTFKELQLADSVISARLPLNVTIDVGVRKTFKLGSAGTVTGFIAAVNHRIDLRSGKELDSFSQITITHVKY